MKSKQQQKNKADTEKTKQPLSFFCRFLAHGLSCAFILFAVGYSVFWCLEPAHFPVSAVKFVGERKYLSQDDLKKAIVGEIKKGFFRLKVSTLQQQLLSLTWVKCVEVRKVWPDQLVIRFEEHQPAAFWGKKGMLSVTGALFYPTLSSVKISNLPVLQGPEGKSGLVWQQFLAMEQTLAPLHLKITHLVLAPRGAWQLRLSNGVTVVLGTNDIMTRLRRYVSAYEKHLHTLKREIAYVDLRYTSGMAIGWRSG